MNFELETLNIYFRTITLVITLLLVAVSSCKDIGSDVPASPDTVLFRRVTVTDPFTSYTLFPNVDSVTMGMLNGSLAHQPLVRVSMNATAVGVLQNGSLPNGAGFPNGSVIFKQIMMNGETVLYAVIYKDSTDPLSGNGWLWAEYHPDGTPAFSVTKRGNGCITCHSSDQGLQHDFVRTFERQH